MKIYLICLQVILLNCAVSILPSWAFDGHQESIQIIQSYVNALQTEDPAIVKNAWDELNANSAARDYMRQNFPKVNYSFQLRGLFYELEEVEGALSIPKKEITTKLPRDVTKFSISQVDDARIQTNGDVVARSQGILPRDNRDIVLTNPNQNRQDNETLLRNRAQSYFDRKFQESPQEMAPRGGTLGTVSQSDMSKIKIFGISTSVTFSKLSKIPVHLDVYLNDRRIVTALKIMDAPESLTLYLEPGANVLKLSLSESQEDGALSSRSIFALFPATTDGVQKFSWILDPSSSQMVRIETLPK